MSWKRDKLGNITDIISGTTPSSGSQAYWDGQNVWITPTDLGQLTEVYITASERNLTDLGLKSCNLTRIPKNSVVMSSRAPIGHLGIAGVDLYTNQGCKSFVCSPQINPMFLYYSLKHRLPDLQALGSGSTFAEVSKSLLEGFEITFPDSIDDQIKIATALNAQLAEVDKARVAIETAVKDIKRLRYLTLEQFFAPFGETETFKIGDKALTTSGSTPSRSQKNYWEPAEIPWVKTGEIAFQPIIETEEAISKKALDECSLRLLPVDTVLVAMYGQGKTRGQSAVLKVPATTNQACFAILPNDTWEPEFLQLWLTYAYQNLRAMSENRGGNQANMNGDLLNSVEVPAPSKDTQKETVQKIRTALAELDKLNESWCFRLDDIKILPNRLLSAIFDRNGEPCEAV